MRSLRAAVLASFVACCSLAACGSPKDSSAPLHAFATEYCNVTAPCCTEAKSQNAAGCASALEQLVSAFGGSYDEAQGNACLVKLRAAKACDFTDAQAACDGVLAHKSAATGTKKPGEACATTSDCAASGDGPVKCLTTFGSGPNGSSTFELCQVQAKGVAGGPCDGTLLANGSRTEVAGATDGPPPAVVRYCEAASGLVCSSSSRTCTMLVADGGPCTDGNVCASGLCDGSTCAARVALGGACTFGTSCVEGAYCAGSTCAAKLAAGAPCSTGSECVGFCDFPKMTCAGQSSSGSYPPLGCFSEGK